jgi:hypothetical protein
MQKRYLAAMMLMRIAMMAMILVSLYHRDAYELAGYDGHSFILAGGHDKS